MEGGGGPSLELSVAVVLVKVVLDGLGGHGRGGTSLHRGSPPVGGIKVNFPVQAEPKFGVVF